MITKANVRDKEMKRGEKTTKDAEDAPNLCIVPINASPFLRVTELFRTPDHVS